VRDGVEVVVASRIRQTPDRRAQICMEIDRERIGADSGTNDSVPVDRLDFPEQPLGSI